MVKLFYFVALVTLVVQAQENALRNLPPSLRECYLNKHLLERDNRPPHTLNTLLAILRKVENSEGPHMDLRTMSIAVLHRFRQDGIVPNPDVPIQDGVTPYAPNSFQFFRQAQTHRFIQGNAMMFPNNSITDIERCTLHFMFSSSVEVYQRGDEGRVCRYSNSAYRYKRDVEQEDTTTPNSIGDDVETLPNDLVEIITKRKDGGVEGTVDPNSLYPELPPHHPDSARLSTAPRSKCPVENGVIKTPWGPVSAGLVLAGIAAGVQPDTVTLQDLQLDETQKNEYPSGLTVENKWIATLAGDMAEVALIQGPVGKKLSVGSNGNWNSTAMPRWYFLGSNENYEFTTAEIRGDLDGLILANEVGKWYDKISSLRLSQVFDMYYSARGLFDPAIRACNRRDLFTAVATNASLTAQAYSAALLLDLDLSRATLDFSIIEKFVVQAVKDLVVYVPGAMNKDLSCADTDRLNDFNQLAVDLTIVLDTKWPFGDIQAILANLLENAEINEFNSNFTIINGYDGSVMINSSSSILDFYNYNSSHYDNITKGFDLPKTLEKLHWRLSDKLDNERNRGVGGGRSDVLLIVPYLSTLTRPDTEYCLQKILRMRELIPDTTLLILAHGSKDTWSDLVRNSGTDLFSIGVGDTEEALAPLTGVIARIKQVPKRLFNSQCGSDYNSIGSTNTFVDYIEPHGVNFYRLHPNYFYSSDSSSVVKIQGSASDSLTVCSSRELLHVNATNQLAAASCATVTNEPHTIWVSCGDATFIHECPPLYISVSSNSTTPSFQCTDRKVCRFPYLMKYTVSYENLVCVSGASNLIFNSFVLLSVLVYLIL